MKESIPKVPIENPGEFLVLLEFLPFTAVKIAQGPCFFEEPKGMMR